MQKFILLILAIAAVGGCTKSNPGEELPPSLSELWPDNNPQGWPVMIKGTNLKNVTSVKFGGIVAQIDTSLDDVITTWVPGGVAPGVVNLVVTNRAGVSNTINFEILSVAPVGPPTAARIILGKKARYLPRLPNGGASNVGWSNPYGGAHSIKFDFAGNLEIYGSNSYPFTILDYPGEEKKIRIKIERDIDQYEIYTGQFIEMDDPNSTSQRILFYNEAKRQIVVVNN